MLAEGGRSDVNSDRLSASIGRNHVRVTVGRLPRRSSGGSREHPPQAPTYSSVREGGSVREGQDSNRGRW